MDILIEQEGFAGYGRWMRLLEIIAFKMDKTNNCSVEYSTKKWCLLLGLKQKKLKTFLELTENKLKTKVVCCKNIIRISIPNLLEKRDNYTKDLEVTSKLLPSKEVEVEVEVEVDKDKEEDKEEKLKRFTIFWKAYPKKKSKGQGEKTWLKINPNEQLLATMLAKIELAKTSDDWTKDNGQFIPYPSTWLNAKGWEDEFVPARGSRPSPSDWSNQKEGIVEDF